MLAKSKLSSIDSLISQALNDLDISHEEFIAINYYNLLQYNLLQFNK